MNYLFDNCVLNSQRRELRRSGRVVPIEPQIFDLLQYLLCNRYRVVSRDDLIAAVWKGRIVSDSTLSSRINAVRSAVGDDGKSQRLIKTFSKKGVRFVGGVTVGERGGASYGASSFATSHRSSIAVLPFTNLSGNRDQDYLCDGIVEDIAIELSRFSELFVIARNSTFRYKDRSVDVRQVGLDLDVRYVLEGSVRQGCDRIRIAAQLIDAVTGAHRWAEHYDRTLEDVFAVQDEVVRTIVTILVAHVRQAEIERSRAKPPSSWQAYDYYLRAVEASGSFSATLDVAKIGEARRLLQQSLALDSNYARSYAALSNTYVASWANPRDQDFLNPAALELGHDFARKAVQLDRNLPQAHAGLGVVLNMKNQHDPSVAAFEKAIALNPNFMDWRFGTALIRAGDSKRAIEVVHAYMRLDPFYEPLAYFILGFAHYMLEQYPQAVSLLREFVAQVPNYRPAHGVLAATLARMGHLTEARAATAAALRLGHYTISGVTRRFISFKYPKDDKHFFDALREAGLPE